VVSATVTLDGDVTPFELPGGQVVTGMRVGSYESLEASYRERTEWAAADGHLAEPSVEHGSELLHRHLAAHHLVRDQVPFRELGADCSASVTRPNIAPADSNANSKRSATRSTSSKPSRPSKPPVPATTATRLPSAPPPSRSCLPERGRQPGDSQVSLHGERASTKCQRRRQLVVA
jgi:hypothetical protein